MVAWLPGALLASRALAQVQDGLNNSTAANVRSRLIESARASWELGTAAEALTEYSWPALSVFERSAFPPPAHLNFSLNATDVLQIAVQTVSTKPANSLPLIANQGSAADPASIGVAVLLANWTRPDPSTAAFDNAASGQLEHLLHDVPRSAEGAISHREDEVQLWADYVYMVPPFIAYYGALQRGNGGRALMQVAYDQCRLYREALRDSSGLWRHVALGTWQDNSHWATGNAWAAAGMLRVLQTLNHSSDADFFTKQQANLTEWIQEITTTAWSYQKSNGALLNVIDAPTSFADTSATALLASVTYRMATLTNDTSLIPVAEKAFAFVKDNIDGQGWLRGTVDPYAFHTPSAPDAHSPEGQAFVLLLVAARSAWKKFISG
ncbi:putative glycosyl hydrolase family 88 [Lyophyllum shimeji]|uniref:Glycosyl hydrolase family 88 n=1 Tax=Lyophyllum shimeji TaxID=47721 RepID=A0A9P3PCR4_LYOSH|nr:putative glycosyl hydrolase family 88 [Lyophyllum shimeji]